ncbi:signal peptidase I [Mesorhizobium hawassense]|nr:signal peptidase I [Mesorhizobium hawassense]
MTEQATQSETASRSMWTSGLIAAFGGPFAGFLWIGAGRLAVISLIAVTAASIAICYAGFPVLPGMDLAAVGRYSGFGLMIVWAAIVAPLARRFKPDKWYAQGVPVFVMAFYATVVAGFIVRTFLFQSFSTPAGSMVPTLLEGDYFFAAKYAYGYSRYSDPFGLMTFDGRVWGAEPRRGDVVVFKFPPDPSIDYIKRVVGLPGEKIQMIEGVLHINGVPVGLEDIGPYASEDSQTGRLQRETLPNGVSYSVVNLTDDAVGDNTRVFEVPGGHYFMLGDNRDNSSDSRFTVGFVPYENLEGKVVRLYWNSSGVDYAARQVVNRAAAN